MNTISALECEWRPLAQRALADALEGWQLEQLALRRFGSPQQLLRFLHQATPAESDGPLLALLTLARADQLPGRFLLQAILPALKVQARRLTYQDTARRDEVWELLLFYAWEAICSYPLEGRPARVAANLVLQVLHDTSRELNSRAVRGERPLAAASRQAAAAGTRSTPGGELLIRAAREAGVISADDAELILRTRTDGIRLKLMAKTSGVSYSGLRQRRQRAEAAIRRWFDSSPDVSKVPVLVLTSTATSPPATRPAPRRTRAAQLVTGPGRARGGGVAPTRTNPGRRPG